MISFLTMQSEPSKGSLNIPKRPKIASEEIGLSNEGLSHRNSIKAPMASIKNERRHHRIIKQASRPNLNKNQGMKANMSIIDPKKCSVTTFQKHFDMLNELHGVPLIEHLHQQSMTFSSTDESLIDKTQKMNELMKLDPCNFDLVNEQFYMGQTPMSDFQTPEYDIPYLDLDN